MGVSFWITGVDQPRPVASESLQHGFEDIAHHLLKVIGPLDGAVDRVQAFQERQLRTVFLLSTLPFGHIHDGGHVFLGLSANVEDGVHDRAQVSQRAVRRDDPELPFDSRRLLDSFPERFSPPRTILRVNTLPKLVERGHSSFRIEPVQAGVLIGGVDYLSGGAIQGSGAGMRQTLRLGQVGLASPQLGRAPIDLYLKLVPGLPKLLFGPRALVDEARALKCCRGVVRGKAKQQPVNLRGKVDSTAGRGNHPTLGIDAYRNDDTVTRLAADVGNDLYTRELAAFD
jgi:hypothetical protein